VWCQGRPDTGNNNGFGDVTGAGALTGTDGLETGTPPVISEVRSPGSDTCCGSGTGRNGICGKLSCAWGSGPEGPVAGAAAAGTVGVNPGIPSAGAVAAGTVGVVNLGIPSAGAVAAGTVGVNPGMPGAVAAGAATVGVNPGIPSPGAAVAAGAAVVAPGMSDDAPGMAEVAPGRPAPAGCGTLIAALANGGGVAGCPPRRPCSSWGALAAEVTSCSPMLGVGTGAGSAWAVPIRPPMSNAADEPTMTVVARNNVRTVDMTLPESR
jgi:hypothetical protein